LEKCNNVKDLLLPALKDRVSASEETDEKNN